MTKQKYLTFTPTIFSLAVWQIRVVCWRWMRRQLPSWRRWFFWRLSICIPEGARKKHTYVSGSSGSGKSEVLKILIYAQRRKRRPGTTILLDPAGKLAAEVARWPENAGGENCILIDLSLKPGFSPVINPLQIADRSPENIDRMAQLFVFAFNEIMDNSQLTLNMKALLHPCVAMLMEMGDASLADLQRMLDDGRNEYLLARVRTCPSFPRFREFFDYSFHQADYATTKRAISRKIQSLLNYQAFYHLTVGKSTIDLKALMDSRQLVLFNLAKGKLGSEAMPAFGKFLVVLLQGLALQREDLPERARVPTHLFIDECQNFLTPAIEEILKESRKYALYLTLAQQSIGNGMSLQMLNTVMTNTEVKITGLNDRQNVDLMAGKTFAEPAELYRLGLGRFSVKVGKGIRPPMCMITIPTFLVDDTHAMTAAEWEALKQQQLQAYYQVPDWEAPPPLVVAGPDPAEFDPALPAPSALSPFQRRQRLPKTPKYRF